MSKFQDLKAAVEIGLTCKSAKTAIVVHSVTQAEHGRRIAENLAKKSDGNPDSLEFEVLTEKLVHDSYPVGTILNP